MPSTNPNNPTGNPALDQYYPGGSSANAAGVPGGVAPAVQPTKATQPSGGTQDYAAIIRELQAQFPATADGFRQLVAALNARGIPAVMASHAGGSQASDDKVVLPDGTYYDIRNDNGWNAPGAPLHWDPAVPVFDASGKSQNYNDVLKGQGLPTFTFNPTAADGMGGPEGGQGGAQGGQGLAGYGTLLQPYDKTFQAPEGTDDPGFKFALKNALDAMQHSAAAHGTLLTGGAQKDLAAYAAGASLQDYAGSYNRAKTTFDTNYNVSRNNKLDPFNMLSTLSGQGLTAAQIAQNANSSYSNNTVDLTTGQGNVDAAATIGGANAWSGVPANLADLANTAFDAYGRRQKPGLVPPPNSTPRDTTYDQAGG